MRTHVQQCACTLGTRYTATAATGANGDDAECVASGEPGFGCGTNERAVNGICYDCGAGEVANNAWNACVVCAAGKFKYVTPPCVNGCVNVNTAQRNSASTLYSRFNETSPVVTVLIVCVCVCVCVSECECARA
jgi:hypothetical protein